MFCHITTFSKTIKFHCWRCVVYQKIADSFFIETWSEPHNLIVVWCNTQIIHLAKLILSKLKDISIYLILFWNIFSHSFYQLMITTTMITYPEYEHNIWWTSNFNILQVILWCSLYASGYYLHWKLCAKKVTYLINQ